MAELEFAVPRRPSRISFLARSPMTLAVVGAVTALFMMNVPEPESDPDARDQPTERAARDDRDGPVWSLAVAPGDARLAWVTINGNVWLKDIATGQSSRLQRGPIGSARSVAFSPDGRNLAIAGGEPRVRFWDLETNTELAALEVGGEATRWVAFSPDGVRLAVGHEKDRGGNGAITLWDWGGRRRLAVLDGQFGRLISLAFSPDGSLLRAADSDGLIMLWDVADGRARVRARLRVREPGMGNATAAVFSPDGTLLASANGLDHHIRLWDAASGALRGTLPTTHHGLKPLAFSLDGRALAMARGDGTAALRDVTTGRELGTVGAPGPSLSSLAFSGDGRRLATGDAGGAVRLREVPRAPGGEPPGGLRRVLPAGGNSSR